MNSNTVAETCRLCFWPYAFPEKAFELERAGIGRPRHKWQKLLVPDAQAIDAITPPATLSVEPLHLINDNGCERGRYRNGQLAMLHMGKGFRSKC